MIYHSIKDLGLSSHLERYCRACGDLLGGDPDHVYADSADPELCLRVNASKPGTVEILWVPIHPPGNAPASVDVGRLKDVVKSLPDELHNAIVRGLDDGRKPDEVRREIEKALAG